MSLGTIQLKIKRIHTINVFAEKIPQLNLIDKYYLLSMCVHLCVDMSHRKLKLKRH